tara:strand:+ start:73 stop:186 length:114 start_codon:yes stop_codon:yes gene_type:complete
MGKQHPESIGLAIYDIGTQADDVAALALGAVPKSILG